jgi:hypothetical protein
LGLIDEIDDEENKAKRKKMKEIDDLIHTA